MADRYDRPHFKELTISPEQLGLFLHFAKEGYTLRAIRRKMEQQSCPLPPTTPDAQLVMLMREHRKDIRSAREEAAKDVLDFVGLTDKMTRVKRLAQIAESLEDGAHANTKKAGEYRRYLQQIQSELEPLNITLAFGDPYGDLLRDIADLAKGQPGAEEVGQEEAFGDPLSETEGDLA